MRQRTHLDHLIANLGKTLLSNVELFESLAKQETSIISVDDLAYLRYKLHHPPPVHPDINENELGLYIKMKNILECKSCGRLWVYWNGFDNDPISYVPEKK